MSGPKCDEIVLSKAEEEKLRRFYEEQLQRERELLCRKREEERRERLRLQEEEKRRREEEKRRREEEQKKKQQDYKDGLSEYMSKLQEMEREQDADREEFDEAFEIYMAACAVTGENPRTFVYEPGAGKELADKLREESERLREQTVANACEKQVDGWIDRTIEEMGYHIIGKKEQTEGIRAVSKLYRYDEKTALHVIGVGGQFTMEIVATDDRERPLKEAEKEALTGSMEHFCEDYKRIRNKLEESGKLEIKNVFHMPVDRKYAALMNESDYRKTKKHIISRGVDYTAASTEEEEAKRRYQ